MIPQAVVDVQIEVEARAEDAIEVGRLEMFDLGQAAKCAGNTRLWSRVFECCRK